jgi:hypothetical protein
MIEKQLSVYLENKPGVLAELCHALAADGVNLKAISISDTVDHSVVRMVVSDPAKAIHILGERGALVIETDILALELVDKPGTLAEAAKKLGKAKVNIEYAYGSGHSGACTMFFRVSDIKKAIRVLCPGKKATKKGA